MNALTNKSSNLVMALLIGVALFLSGCASKPILPLSPDGGSQVLDVKGGTFILPITTYNVSEATAGGYRLWDKKSRMTIFLATNEAAEATGRSKLAAPWSYDILSSEMVSEDKGVATTKEKILLSGGCHRMMVIAKSLESGFAILEYSDKRETTSGKGVTNLLSHWVPAQAVTVSE
jgi:hypothetical protein